MASVFGPEEEHAETGPPGIGETTSISKIAMMLREEADGFYTKETREDGERMGFKTTSLDGESGVLAYEDFEGDQNVGRYGVNIADLDRVGVGAIWHTMNTRRVVIVDELGKIELFSSGLRIAVLEAFGSHPSCDSDDKG